MLLISKLIFKIFAPFIKKVPCYKMICTPLIDSPPYSVPTHRRLNFSQLKLSVELPLMYHNHNTPKYMMQVIKNCSTIVYQEARTFFGGFGGGRI